MGITEALGVLSEQWRDIRARLDPEGAARLDTLVTYLAREADPALSEEHGHRIADLLGRVLPQDHPFRRALAGDTRRSVAATRDPDTLADWLLLTESLGAEVEPPAQRLHQVAQETSGWLLAEPAVTADWIRASGLDPYAPELIRLDRPDGGEQWPAFQFSPDGVPVPVVREINLMLDAEDDPYGVADWWLGENHLAGGVPARLIGQVDDAMLVELAQLERTEG
jgi:hypothetical protein